MFTDDHFDHSPTDRKILNKLDYIETKLDDLERKTFKTSTFWYFIACIVGGIFWNKIWEFIIAIFSFFAVLFIYLFDQTKEQLHAKETDWGTYIISGILAVSIFFLYKYLKNIDDKRATKKIELEKLIEKE